MATSTDRGRVLRRASLGNVGSAVYGAIVTAAVLATVPGHSSGAGRVVVAEVFVLTTYWLAHVYVHALNAQFEGSQDPLHRRLAHHGVAEASVLMGGVPAMVVFLVASAWGRDPDQAALIALWFTVLLLMVIVFVASRDAGLPLRRSLLEAAGGSLFGVLMIVAKTLLH